MTVNLPSNDQEMRGKSMRHGSMALMQQGFSVVNERETLRNGTSKRTSAVFPGPHSHELAFLRLSPMIVIILVFGMKHAALLKLCMLVFQHTF